MHSFPTRRSYVLQEEEVPFEHYTSPIHRADSTARRGARSRSALAARLEQEPRALLGLIGPVVEDAAGRVVLGVVDDVLGLAQRLDQLEEIGRAHVRTPVTNAHLVCRLLIEKKNKSNKNNKTT